MHIKDMSYLNGLQNIEDEAIVECGIVKEESITIVKHEVDEYLSEIIEVVRPENTVLKSKGESENDETVEVLQPEYTVLDSKEESENVSVNNVGHSEVDVEFGDIENTEEEHIDYGTNKEEVDMFDSEVDVEVDDVENAEDEDTEYGTDDEYETFDVDESITIVNHQVEDFSLETVEVVQPENTVVESIEKLGGFGCDECDKRFSYMKLLRRHMLVHQKPFRCDTCGERFGSKSGIKVHLYRHTGERPYACRICGKSYRSVNSRHVHEKSHKKRLEVECTTVESRESYSCETCDRTFSRIVYLKKHQRTVHCSHKKKWRYQCYTCPKKFTFKCSLGRHIKKQHMNK